MEFRVWAVFDMQHLWDDFPALASDFWHRLGTARDQVVVADRRTVSIRERRLRFCGSQFVVNRRSLLFKGRVRRIVGHAREGELFGFGATADPEEAVEIDAGSSGGLGVKRVRHVDPGADAVVVCQTREEGEGQGCPTGALGPGELGDGADGKAALESVVESGNAGGGCWTEDTRRRGERRGDAVGEGSFNLLAEVGGGGHTVVLSPYLRLFDGGGARGICTGSEEAVSKKPVS